MIAAACSSANPLAIHSNNTQMAAHPDYKISLLEDRDGDGVYEHSQVYADKLTLPAGAVWYRNSLYVRLSSRPAPLRRHKRRWRRRCKGSDRYRLEHVGKRGEVSTDRS